MYYLGPHMQQLGVHSPVPIQESLWLRQTLLGNTEGLPYVRQLDILEVYHSTRVK